MMSATVPPEDEGFQSSCTQEPQGASQRVFRLVESEMNPTLVLK